MTIFALVEFSPGHSPLELYPTDTLFPIWKRTEGCFTLGYKDEIVGAIRFINHGPCRMVVVYLRFNTATGMASGV